MHFATFLEVNYLGKGDKAILMQNDTPLKLVLQFAVEQFSQPSTHLLVSVYIVCQQLLKVLNNLIGCKYYQQILKIDLKMPIAQLSWNE